VAQAGRRDAQEKPLVFRDPANSRRLTV